MNATVLKGLTKTSKGLLALSLLALVTACGGGGGGGGSKDAGVVDKLDILSPKKDAQITVDNLYQSELTLRYLTQVDRNKLVLQLNGHDISGFLKNVVGSANEQYIPMAQLQGLLQEGENKLFASMQGSSSETVKFQADVAKPFVYLEQQFSEGGKDYVAGFVRSGDIATATLNGQTITSSKARINAIDIAGIAEPAVPGSDKKPDYQFEVTDNSAALIADGNKATTQFAKAGRLFEAGSAVQINSGAFDVVSVWLEDTISAYLKNRPAFSPLDKNFPNGLLQGDIGFQVCKQKVLPFVQRGSAVSGSIDVFTEAVETCQVFLENIKNESVQIDITDISAAPLSGLPAGVSGAAVTIKANVGMQFDALIKGYETSASSSQTYEQSAKLKLPLELKQKNPSLTLKFSLATKYYNGSDWVGEPGALYLQAAKTDVVYTLDMVAQRNASGGEVKSSCEVSPGYSSCVTEGEFDGTGTIASAIGGPNGIDIAQEIYQNLAVQLFCPEQDALGNNNGKCDPGTEQDNTLNNGYKTLITKKDTLQPVETESGDLLALLKVTTQTSTIGSVNDAGKSGVFLRMAQKTQALSDDVRQNPTQPITNASFKQLLGSQFVSVVSDLLASPAKIASSGEADVSLAVSLNAVNQNLAAAIFQTGVVEQQQFSLPLSELGVTKAIDPQNFDCATPSSNPGVHIPKLLPTYKIKFGQPGGNNDIALTTAPFIKVVNGKPMLFVTGLKLNGELYNDSDEKINLGGERAVSIEVDVKVPLLLEVHTTGANKGLLNVGIDTESLALSLPKFENFVNTQYKNAKSCKAFTGALGQIKVNEARKLLAEAKPQPSDLYGVIPEQLAPLLDKLNNSLLKTNSFTLDIANAQAFLPTPKKLNIMLEQLGVSPEGDYLSVAATLCDGAAAVGEANACEQGKKPFYSIIIQNASGTSN